MDNLQIYRPRWRQEWRILCTEDTEYQTYYAFPALLHLNDEVLITLKSGMNHVSHEAASLTQVRLDARRQQVIDTKIVYNEPEFIAQMGEIVHMPNGDVCIYIDMQRYDPNRRSGMWELRSYDGGLTYPISRRVGVIDGIEYGYPMSMVEKDGRIWMLVMTFANQIGGRNREVHMITSDDNGESWKFCANLKEKFGFPFNECDLLLCDEGFLVFTRGESERNDRKNSKDDFESGQHLVLMDSDYNVLRMRDYRHTTDFFTLTGRPRLYWLNGELCLFTRQWNEKRMMCLDMFRIDIKTMDILAHVRLDDPRFPEQDGHYPAVYIQDDNLHVVTYITCNRDEHETFAQKCDLVQLSYHLDEVLGFGKERHYGH